MTDTHIQRHTHTERERNIYTEKNTLRYILTLRETHILRRDRKETVSETI